jgi:23S rRNA (pseudouridine1915-N3)-methyltransferase
MQWKIITVGKPVFPWARAALEEYLGRLQRVAKVEHFVIKDGPLAQVETQIQAASEDSARIVLDERGRQLRSTEFASWIQHQDNQARKRATLIIGGASGHSAALRKSADEVWSLSSFTLQHEIALIVVAEQLYRAYSILKNEPYHRE